MDALTLQGILTLDKSQYDKGLDDADNSARSFGGRFSKTMKVGAAAAVAFGAAAGFAGKKLVGGAKEVAAYGDHVDKMSQKIGISSDAYQKWDYVMQRAGGNVDSLKMGMKTLSQQAEKGSDAFQKLGISQEEVGNLSKEELFEKTVKGLSEMEEGTERTALATQLLGRAGADMGPLLNQGSDAIEEQMEIAEKYGMVMPESTVKASAAFEDSMTTMQMTAQGLKNRLLGEFLPSMTKVTDGLALMFTGDMSGLDDVTAGIKDFIGKIGEMAPKVIEAGGKIIISLGKGLVQKLPDMISSGAKIFGTLLSGIQESLKNAGPVIGNVITAIVQFITANLPLIIQTGVTLLVALGKGLILAIPTIVRAIPKIIRGISKAFSSYSWSKIGSNIIKAIGNGLASFATTIKSKVTDKITAVKDKVKGIIDKIKGFFPLKIGKIFSGLKLPHFTVKGKAPFGLGGMGEKPKISVNWYKKAYETPYLFDRPTVISGMGFGDGVGDEMVYGKSSLMGDIKEAVRQGGANNTTYFNVTVNGAESPEEWADKFTRQLKLNMRTA